MRTLKQIKKEDGVNSLLAIHIQANEAKSEFTADVIQFMMPDGRESKTWTRLPMETHTAYLDMQKHGCRFEAEVLMTGVVSVTISNPKEEVDVDIEIIPNGPDVQKGMIAMLNRGLWRESYNE